MALYAIGDTHLSLRSDKPMDVFGGGWEGYVDKLREGFAPVKDSDTVVLCGDLSWGMILEEARDDFAFLNSELPGEKWLLKGNHDYWWTTASISSTITALPMGTPPCAAPGAGSSRRTARPTGRRCSTGSLSGWRRP